MHSSDFGFRTRVLPHRSVIGRLSGYYDSSEPTQSCRTQLSCPFALYRREADRVGSHVLYGAHLRTDLGTHQLSGGFRHVGRFSPSIVGSRISHSLKTNENGNPPYRARLVLSQRPRTTQVLPVVDSLSLECLLVAPSRWPSEYTSSGRERGGMFVVSAPSAVPRQIWP